MQLFICWSGEKSRQIAKTLHGWLPQVITDLDPFISVDIPKGRRWFEEVRTRLESAQAGIICLTPDNIASPWLHFEAGALATKLFRPDGEGPGSGATPIFTYLDGVDPRDVTGPLAAYQATSTTEEDTRLLVQSIARTMCLGDSRWKSKFEERWPDLKTKLRDELSVGDLVPTFEGLFRLKAFDEPITACTAQDWMERHVGVRQTYLTLRPHAPSIHHNSRPYFADLYDELLSQVDGYAIDLGSLLGRRFELGADGQVQIEPVGIARALEQRRSRIKRLVARILDVKEAPVSDQAWRYQTLTTFDERKVLIHREEKRIRDENIVSDRPRDALRLDSSWDFDRIVYYLIQENTLVQDRPPHPSAADLVRCATMELERVEANATRPSLTPLHYAVRALGKALDREDVDEQLASNVDRLLASVEAYIARSYKPEEQRQIRRNIRSVRERLGAGRGAATAQPDGAAPDR